MEEGWEEKKRGSSLWNSRSSRNLDLDLTFQIIRKIYIKAGGWSIFPLFLALAFKLTFKYPGKKCVASICTFDRAPQIWMGVTFPYTQLFPQTQLLTVGND